MILLKFVIFGATFESFIIVPTLGRQCICKQAKQKLIQLNVRDNRDFELY